ncbi:MAG: helix-turn-helix domain-containing protein [Thermoguttaceae bacterium]|jgi:HTH-type transcriptional regulator/antitoxin HigA
MPKTRHIGKSLPGRFEELVRMAPPQAIMDDVHYENMLEIIDRLMAAGKLTKGQALYLETLVQLVDAYEADRHSIETSQLSALDSLKHLLQENDMNASDLARLLGVHPSMGSKILRGERSMTVDHVRTLSARFKVNPRLFID